MYMQCNIVTLHSHEQLFLLNFHTVPAAITAEQSNVTVIEGQSVSLNCQASGDPPPSITWYKVVILILQLLCICKLYLPM